MWYEFFKYALFGPGVRALWHPRVVGEENIPTEGGVILACNHIAALDPIIVASMIDRKLTYPAKKELFAGDRGLWSKVVAWFLRAVEQVPLDRSGGRTSVNAMGPVERRLAEGGLVGIFPEGTRSSDGRLYKGKTGVARMTLGSGAPVVPVGISGTTVRRKVLGIPLLDHPTLIFGKPMHFDVLADRTEETAVLRWVTDEVMGAISDLTGQSYVDVYGFRVKHGNLKGKDVSKFVKPRPGGKPLPPPRVAKA